MKVPMKKHAGYDPLGACGKGKCPVCARNNAVFSVKQSLRSEEFSSDAVAPFVGRFGYPNINVGILAPPVTSEEAWLYDAPKYWSGNNYEIPKIVDFRSSLLNSRQNWNIKKKTRMLEISQDVAMSSLPVDVDIKLKEKPKFRLNVDNYMAPTGPNARLEKVSITENPKIHTKVYKVFSDTDMKAADAVNYLYQNSFDENFLSRIFSVGTVGIGKNRKLVPTRWSITATDDTIGKNLISQIKDYGEIGAHHAYFGNYLGNYYLILMFPGVWSYELFETYVPNNWDFSKQLRYSTDFENYDGRKNYADNTAGGYYTVRLAVLEKLLQMKRQASCLALRFITDDYEMPLGVWVTREATRKAMENKIEFASRELMLEYARKLAKKYFNYNADFLLRESKLFSNIRSQSKLVNFL